MMRVRVRNAILHLSVLAFLCMRSFFCGADGATGKQRAGKKVAVATLVTTSNYVAGAEVLAESLNNVNAIGDRILFYVLAEDDSRSDLTEQDLTDLRDAGWQLRKLTKKDGTFSECIVSKAEQPVVDATPSTRRYWGTCSKFAIFSLEGTYDAVIYIDSDSLVLNNFDSVFELVLDAEEGIAFFANGCPGFWDDPPTSDEFYGAFMAVRPSVEIQKYLYKVAQTYSAAQGELMLLNNVFKQTWKPLPRYTLVAQTERLRPPTNPPSLGVDWSQVKVYDFSGLPETKPWVTYWLQKRSGDKFLHSYLGRIPAGTRNFYIYMHPQWIWNDLYDAVLERKKVRSENGICKSDS